MVFLSRAKGKGQCPDMGFGQRKSLEGRGGLTARGGQLGIHAAHSSSESSAAPEIM